MAEASEQQTQQAIRLQLGRGPVRLFRNNVGTGWAGQAQPISHPCTVQLRPGDVVIRNGRPLHAGLEKGSSDLIGLRTVTVTPEMVGQRLAVFAALEVKGPKGRLTAEQRSFLEMVEGMGGFAGEVRSVEDGERVLRLR